MAVSLQNFGALVANSAAVVQGACSTLIDLTVGSVVRALLEASASVALWLQFLVLQVLARTRLATSAGPDVDSWVDDFGVTRLGATFATGAVTLTSLNPNAQAATVPVGATVRTNAGVSFAVVLDPTNTAYSASAGGYIRPAGTASIVVPIQAVVAASGGNVAAGAINLLGTPISGIDTCSNANAITDAIDTETDAALRARFVSFINSRAAATQLAVENAISGAQTGLLYQVVPNTDATGASRPGYFTCYVDDGSGNPPAALLTAVYAAVDLVRPIGTAFAVLPPAVTQATVSLMLAVAAGYSAASVAASVQTAVTAYVDALGIGATASYSRINNIAYSTAGVTNVTALLLNGGTFDIAAAQGVAIRAQTILVTTA